MEKTRSITVVRQLTVERKKCVQCGTSFEGLKKSRFCSKACANKMDYKRHAGQRRQQRLETYYRQKEQGR